MWEIGELSLLCGVAFLDGKSTFFLFLRVVNKVLNKHKIRGDITDAEPF